MRTPRGGRALSRAASGREAPDALEAKAAELDAIGDADSLEAERAQRAAQCQKYRECNSECLRCRTHEFGQLVI